MKDTRRPTDVRTVRDQSLFKMPRTVAEGIWMEHENFEEYNVGSRKQFEYCCWDMKKSTDNFKYSANRNKPNQISCIQEE